VGEATDHQPDRVRPVVRDAAERLLAQLADERLDGEEHAVHVDGHHLAIGLERQLVERDVRRDAGVVDEDGAWAEALADGVRQHLYVVGGAATSCCGSAPNRWPDRRRRTAFPGGRSRATH
jgi:hypothetical protein